MKFRKKPMEVEAVQWTGKNPLEIGCFLGKRAERTRDNYLVVETLEGSLYAKKNDWIIKGVAGEFYPCNECEKCGKPCDIYNLNPQKDEEPCTSFDDTLYTKGQMDSYAMENVEVERNRIHSILSNSIVKKEEITQEVLSKVILGNRK